MRSLRLSTRVQKRVRIFRIGRKPYRQRIKISYVVCRNVEIRGMRLFQRIWYGYAKIQYEYYKKIRTIKVLTAYRDGYLFRNYI